MTAGGRFGSMGLYTGGSAAGVVLQTQSPRLIKQILRIQNKISYAYERLRDGWAQRTISHALQEGYYFVPRHVSRKSLNYMHTKYLKIDF